MAVSLSNLFSSLPPWRLRYQRIARKPRKTTWAREAEALSKFSVFCRWKINLPSSISTGRRGRDRWTDSGRAVHEVLVR